MKRTTQSNSYYWGCVIEQAMDFYKQNPAQFYQDADLALKGLNGRDAVHAMFKMIFNGGHTTQFTDTPNGLTGKQKMAQYIDKIRGHFLHEHKKDIPPAGTPPIEIYEESNEHKA